MTSFIPRVFILWFATLALVQCTPRSKDSIVVLPSGKKIVLPYRETLNVNLKMEPPTLDWVKATDAASSLVNANIMTGLVTYDLKDPELKIQPGLAVNWNAERNSQRWTFSLRKGVKWTDGLEFKAQDVVDGWEYLLNPKYGNRYAYFLFGIKNAEAYNSGDIKDFSQVGVKLLSDHLIQVDLEKPMSFFPLLLTHHSTYPFRKDLFEKYGDRWSEAEYIQTLGPFKVVFWKHDQEILIERNDQYYGNKASLKYVHYYMVEKEATAVRMFDRGKLDFLRELPAMDKERLAKRKEYISVPSLTSYYYGFKVNKPPFDDVRVRKAFAHALDKNELVRVSGGGESVLNSWVPKGMFGHFPEVGLKFNPAKAKQFLEDAGYGPEKAFPPIILGFNSNDKHRLVAENVQAQLKKHLGVQIELKNEEWKSYISNLKTSDYYNIYRMGWVADFPDPHNFLNILSGNSSQNRTGWKNADYDRDLIAGRSELEKEVRRNIYRRAQRILTEQEVPVIPVWSGTNEIMVSSRVENFPVNALEIYIFKDVRIKQ